MAGGLFVFKVTWLQTLLTSWGKFSISCLNEYEWDDTMNSIVDYSIEHYYPLLYFSAAIILFSSFVFVVEKFIAKFKRIPQ